MLDKLTRRAFAVLGVSAPLLGGKDPRRITAADIAANPELYQPGPIIGPARAPLVKVRTVADFDYDTKQWETGNAVTLRRDAITAVAAPWELVHKPSVYNPSPEPTRYAAVAVADGVQWRVHPDDYPALLAAFEAWHA